MLRDGRRSAAGRVRVDILVRNSHCMLQATLVVNLLERAGRSSDGQPSYKPSREAKIFWSSLLILRLRNRAPGQLFTHD